MVNAPVLCDPDVVLVPVHPPDAVQEVAFVELHVSVAELPEMIERGDTEKEMVGREVV